jgi:hypothetical protein
MLYKLGKQPARIDSRTLKLSDYTLPTLKPAPWEFNLSGKITNLGMMLNDSLGDCTCACVGHIVQQWTAENGSEIIIPDADILSVYEAVGGYIPDDPSTDNGAVILDVLNYWKKNSIDNNALKAYVGLNYKDGQEVTNTVYYFGSMYIGVQLPISAQDQDIWDVPSEGVTGNGSPGSWGGHAIPIVAYDKYHLTCITWGALKKMTWNFYYTYCDEAYALLSPDWFNETSGKCPIGFDLAQLQVDLQLIS